jgi:hypothetical protein
MRGVGFEPTRPKPAVLETVPLTSRASTLPNYKREISLNYGREISAYNKMYNYTYLFLATISAFIAIYTLYILFLSIDKIQTPNPKIDIV